MLYICSNTVLACETFNLNKQEGADVLIMLGSQNLRVCLFNQFLHEKMRLEYAEHCLVGTTLWEVSKYWLCNVTDCSQTDLQSLPYPVIQSLKQFTMKHKYEIWLVTQHCRCSV